MNKKIALCAALLFSGANILASKIYPKMPKLIIGIKKIKEGVTTFHLEDLNGQKIVESIYDKKKSIYDKENEYPVETIEYHLLETIFAFSDEDLPETYERKPYEGSPKKILDITAKGTKNFINLKALIKFEKSKAESLEMIFNKKTRRYVAIKNSDQ